MPTIQDFIEKRRKELIEALRPLTNERTQIEARIFKLRQELAQLDRAAKAVGVETQPEFPLPQVTAKAEPAITIKEAVIQVLTRHPKGLTALEILANINQQFELGIVRTSLSPQLSRLKQERQIENEGQVWTLIAPKKEGSAK